MVKISSAKKKTKKIYEQSTDMCSCGKQWGESIPLLPTSTAPQRSKNCLCTMKFLVQHDLHDENKHAKCEGQKIRQNKVI
jgi:hypothetical protein